MNIIELLTKEGFRIYVVAPVDKYIHYKEKYRDVVHIPLKKLSRNSSNPIKDVSLIFELNSIYRHIKPDVILHYTVKPNIYGGIAAHWNKIPSVAVVTGLGYAFIHNGYVRKVTELLYKLTSKYHNKMIFENVDDRELFEKTKLIKKGLGISIKGCGVDTDHYKFKKNKRTDDKTIFTFIGRLIYDKGVKEFVNAAKLIKQKYDNVEFWLVGEIDKQNPAALRNDDLVRWVKEKTVIYHGSTNDVKTYISKSDCIVLPSYREAIARTITEGMAMEKPVITTITAGCREAVDEGINGFLVPIKDEVALSFAMEKIIKMSDEQKQKMGKRGREKVLREFDDKIIANQIYDILNNVLNES